MPIFLNLMKEKPLESFVPGNGYLLNVYDNGDISFHIKNNKVPYESFKQIFTNDIPEGRPSDKNNKLYGKNEPYNSERLFQTPTNNGTTVVKKLGSFLDKHFKEKRNKIIISYPPGGKSSYSVFKENIFIYLKFRPDLTEVFIGTKKIIGTEKIMDGKKEIEIHKVEIPKENCEYTKFPVNLSQPIYEFYKKVPLVLSESNKRKFSNWVTKINKQ